MRHLGSLNLFSSTMSRGLKGHWWDELERFMWKNCFYSNPDCGEPGQCIVESHKPKLLLPQVRVSCSPRTQHGLFGKCV